MKTLSTLGGLLSLALLVASLGTGCALPSGTTSTEEEESVSAAQSAGDDDSTDSDGSRHQLAQPIAPDRGDLGQCTSCGPGPQPWQDSNPIHVTSHAR